VQLGDLLASLGLTGNTMNITLDIAAALSAVIWPVIVLVILLAYRSRIPTLIEGLSSCVKKIEAVDVSLELTLDDDIV
jgi:hypothetical protein